MRQNHFRNALRLAAVLVTISLIVGWAAEATTNHNTAQWLVDHVPDSARLAADSQAEEIAALTRQWSNAQTWDWQLLWNTDEKAIVQWQGEGVRYLLVDERTYDYESLARRLRRLTDQGAVLAYESHNVLGVGAHQAILALEKK